MAILLIIDQGSASLSLCSHVRRREDEADVWLSHDVVQFSHRPLPTGLALLLSRNQWFLSAYFLKRLYLFMRDTHREAETQAEGEAGFLQGA